MSVLLAIAYAAVAALLLNLNLASAWSLRVKLGAIGLVSLLYAGSWVGIEGLAGWPAEARLPDRFEVEWVSIDEPVGDDAGGIYFWLRTSEDDARVSRPRAYALPFDDANADAAREALTLLQEGKRIEGRVTLQPLDPSRDEGAQAAEPAQDEVPGVGPPDRPRFEFRELPPPDLPAKPPL